MERIHPEPEQSEQNREQNREQNVRQSKVKFQLIQYIYQSLILYLVMNIIFCIFVASKNNDYSQIIGFCTFEIILMVIIIICLLYQYYQIIEAKNQARFNNEHTQSEIEANSLIYQSTMKFVISFINQSKYLWIKIILLYSSLGIVMLIVQIYKSSLYVCMCYDSIENQYYEYNYSELKCLLEKDCRIEEFETNSFPYLNQVTLINWPIIVILIVFQFAYVLIKPLTCFCRTFIQEYQYTNNNIQKQNARSYGSFLSGTIIFYSLSKLIVYSLLMILTQNTSCYVLVSSNLFYHLLIIFVFNKIRHIINQEQAIEDVCYKNSQILIDSILWMKNCRNGLFRIGLILCLIFTSLGQLIYNRQKKNTNIVNYDVFIEFDCGIFQFIILTILIYKYIIYQNWNKHKILVFDKYFNGSNQELSTNQSSMQNQSILINSRLQTQPNASIPQQQSNLFKQLKLVSQAQSVYMMVQPLTSDEDCVICFDSLKKGSNNVVQLKCHYSHLFHKGCIIEWFQNQKICPLCKEVFLFN